MPQRLAENRLIFAAPEEFGVSANLIEPDDVRARLKAFRGRVLAQPAGWFESDKKISHSRLWRHFTT
jgi:hypothetical protein